MVLFLVLSVFDSADTCWSILVSAGSHELIVADALVTDATKGVCNSIRVHWRPFAVPVSPRLPLPAPAPGSLYATCEVDLAVFAPQTVVGNDREKTPGFKLK